jgi:hypothetical protein
MACPYLNVSLLNRAVPTLYGQIASEMIIHTRFASILVGTMEREFIKHS